jgi:tRNA(fMet)-specific endonuclease VapC
MKHFMLDTNTVSYIAKGRSHAARLMLEGLAGGDMACVSAITEGELRYGLAKVAGSSIHHATVDGLLRKLMILPWDSDTASVYGTLRAKLQTTGRTLQSLDLLIAAHAIASQSILVSSDKVFRQVDDLPGLVDWATDL